ncbi:MAG: hypothetical protein ACPG5T_04275 [Endozoicomonas sp.]
MNIARNLSKRAIIALLTTLIVSQASGLSLEEDGLEKIMKRLKTPTTLSTQTTGHSADGNLEFSYQVGGNAKTVTLLDPLPVRTLENGEEIELQLYQAEVDGHPAILAMEDDTLMLNRRDVVEDRLVHYQVDFNESEASEQLLQANPSTRNAHRKYPIDVELKTPDALINQRKITTSSPHQQDKTIRLFVFKHQDVRDSIGTVTHNLFSWWVREMHHINQRHMNRGGASLFPDITIDFRSAPDIQSFNYGGDPVQKLMIFASKVQNYQDKHELHGTFSRYKFILITRHWLDWKTLGIAYEGGQYGMASSGNHQVAGHELGHMFNGRHEYADILYNGWWCETAIFPEALPLRSNCFRHTDKNRDVIADYLNEW